MRCDDPILTMWHDSGWWERKSMMRQALIVEREQGGEKRVEKIGYGEI